jgi:hypothetical protein
VGTVHSLVANNTLVRPQHWILRILQESTSSGGYTLLTCASNRFLNNVVYFDRSDLSTCLNIGVNTDPASFQFGNNLWYAFNQPSQSQPNLPSAETNGIYGLDPLFIDEAGGDFSLATNSPAAGSAMRLPEARADLLARCYANPPSIGAFEADPPAVEQADSDGDGMPDVWEEGHQLNRLDPSDAGIDTDGDRLNSVDEFIAGTDPNNARSVFLLRSVALDSSQLSFRCQTVTGRVYRVESRWVPSGSPWTEIGMTSGSGAEWAFTQSVGGELGHLFRVSVNLASD